MPGYRTLLKYVGRGIPPRAIWYSAFIGCLGVFWTSVQAHYWCNVVGKITFSDGKTCPESKVRIFYLPDSLYWVTPNCGLMDSTFRGHCDPTNTMTYFSPGYYQKSAVLTETCERISLGAQPPPQPIARATCAATLEPGPMAHAGFNHTAVLFERDTLDGSGSIPLQGHSISSYYWVSHPDNPGFVVFSDSTSAKPDYIPIAVGTYKFFLTVGDDQGLSAMDTAVVEVCNPGEECTVPVSKRRFSFPAHGITIERRGTVIEFGNLSNFSRLDFVTPSGRILSTLPNVGRKTLRCDIGMLPGAANTPLIAIGRGPGNEPLRSHIFSR